MNSILVESKPKRSRKCLKLVFADKIINSIQFSMLSIKVRLESFEMIFGHKLFSTRFRCFSSAHKPLNWAVCEYFENTALERTSGCIPFELVLSVIINRIISIAVNRSAFAPFLRLHTRSRTNHLRECALNVCSSNKLAPKLVSI